MNQSDQIQFVLDATAMAARIVINQIRSGDLTGLELDEEGLRRLLKWAMNPLRERIG